MKLQPRRLMTVDATTLAKMAIIIIMMIIPPHLLYSTPRGVVTLVGNGCEYSSRSA